MNPWNPDTTWSPAVGLVNVPPFTSRVSQVSTSRFPGCALGAQRPGGRSARDTGVRFAPKLNPKTAHSCTSLAWRTTLDVDCQRIRRVYIAVARKNKPLPVSKSGEVSRHAGTACTVQRASGGAKIPLALSAQVSRRGKGHPEITINGVALCIARHMPLIMIGVYIPRIPTRGAIK
jgi:hypothetical protein